MTVSRAAKNRKQVFLCWSGERSHKIARALRRELGRILGEEMNFLVSDDIPKGTDWLRVLLEHLSGASYGILCLTPGNQNSPWIHFEAGVLYRTIPNRVAPFVVELDPSALDDPLKRLQIVSCTKPDVWKLVQDLNELLGSKALPEGELGRSFSSGWVYFKKRIEQIPKERIRKECDETPPAPPLSKEEHRVLCKIEKSEPYLCERDLAEMLRIDRNRIAALVRPLLKKKYVAAGSPLGSWGRRFSILQAGREYLGGAGRSKKRERLTK